jgi:hypothetical protein
VAEEFLDCQHRIRQQQVRVSGALSSFFHERSEHLYRVGMPHRLRCDMNVAWRLVSVAEMADSLSRVGE